MSPREALHGQDIAVRLQAFLEEALEQFPHEIIITDWNGHSYSLGLKQPHWRGIPLEIHLKTKEAGRDLLSLDAMAFLDRFVAGDVDMTGNIYMLAAIRDTMNLTLPWWRLLPRIIAGRTYLFQNLSRARVNFKTHYDIPQEALQLYLDRVYMSYSCGMFEHPALAVDELVRIGRGRSDDFDSLEKAQWRKFKDAVDFVSPAKGETLLDVGCGYARPTARRARELSVRQGRWLDALAQPGRGRQQRPGAVSTRRAGNSTKATIVRITACSTTSRRRA